MTMALIDVKQMVRDILDANETHSIEGDLTDENECFDLAVEAAEKHIQSLPPVAVEGDLVERLNKEAQEYEDSRMPAHQTMSCLRRVEVMQEAAQAITVLQGRVEAIREECAAICDQLALNGDSFRTSEMATVYCDGYIDAAQVAAKAIREGRIP